MRQVFSDAARGELAAPISATDTSLTILAGGASLFPVADLGTGGPEGSWFKLILQDDAGIEIVYVAVHAAGSDTFGVGRGMEGTVARAWTVPTVVGLRGTAANADSLERLRYEQVNLGASPFYAKMGCAYWLRGSGVVVLPTVRDSYPIFAASDRFVRFIKDRDAVPTIQTTGGEAIVTEKGSDTSVIFDVNAELIFTSNDTDWEV